jgi:hypothetical protein
VGLLAGLLKLINNSEALVRERTKEKQNITVNITIFVPISCYQMFGTSTLNKKVKLSP